MRFTIDTSVFKTLAKVLSAFSSDVFIILDMSYDNPSLLRFVAKSLANDLLVAEPSVELLDDIDRGKILYVCVSTDALRRIANTLRKSDNVFFDLSEDNPLRIIIYRDDNTRREHVLESICSERALEETLHLTREKLLKNTDCFVKFANIKSFNDILRDLKHALNPDTLEILISNTMLTIHARKRSEFTTINVREGIHCDAQRSITIRFEKIYNTLRRIKRASLTIYISNDHILADIELRPSNFITIRFEPSKE